MLAIDPKFIIDLGAVLFRGNGSLLERILRKKLQQMSKEIFNELTEGDLNSAIRMGRRFGRPFNQLRLKWLVGEKPLDEQSIYDLLEDAVRNGGKVKIRKPRTGESIGWKQSRKYWLGDDWRHDWRSQPRDRKTGRWIPGRLKHPYISKGARRLRAARRRAARSAFKNLKV